MSLHVWETGRVTLWRRYSVSLSRINLFQPYPSVRGCGGSCKHSKSLTYIAQPEELQIQNLLLFISCTELVRSLAFYSTRYPSMFNVHIGFLCSLQHSAPFWGTWQDCQGQAGRCNPWLPTEDDLFPHPRAASGSAAHLRDPETGIHC